MRQQHSCRFNLQHCQVAKALVHVFDDDYSLVELFLGCFQLENTVKQIIVDFSVQLCLQLFTGEELLELFGDALVLLHALPQVAVHQVTHACPERVGLDVQFVIDLSNQRFMLLYNFLAPFNHLIVSVCFDKFLLEFVPELDYGKLIGLP